MIWFVHPGSGYWRPTHPRSAKLRNWNRKK